MGFWNKFPYTDFHEMNLDWIMEKIAWIEDKLSKTYDIPLASKTKYGRVKISSEDGNILTVDEGVIDVQLPKADTDSYGVVRVGDGLRINPLNGDLETVGGVEPGDHVQYEQILEDGVPIGKITINDVDTTIFSPAADSLYNLYPNGLLNDVPLDTFYVDDIDGNDDNNTGSQLLPYKTIKHCITQHPNCKIIIPYKTSTRTVVVNDLTVNGCVIIEFNRAQYSDQKYKLTLQFENTTINGKFYLGYYQGADASGNNHVIPKFISTTVGVNGVLSIIDSSIGTDSPLCLYDFKNYGTFVITPRGSENRVINTNDITVQGGHTGYTGIYMAPGSKLFASGSYFYNEAGYEPIICFTSTSGTRKTPMPLVVLDTCGTANSAILNGNAIVFTTATSISTTNHTTMYLM